MASPRSQSTKGVEKRKRDKVDQEDMAQKKKRRSAKAAAADKNETTASTPSKNGDARDSLEGGTSTLNGSVYSTKALQQWRISEPMGGRMSDVDPIFSDDEK